MKIYLKYFLHYYLIMTTSFDIYELYIYFNFNKYCNNFDEIYDKIYQDYRENINKNNKKVGQFIFDIVNNQSSSVTFDSGFDIFNITNQTLLGKQTNLIDFGINCAMKLKKFQKNINNNIIFENDYSSYIFDKSFCLDNYINYLNNQINKKEDLINNYYNCFSGYYLYPRSSMGCKTSLRCANSVGIIDSGYRGSIKGCLNNISEMEFILKSGERYMQLCPANISFPTIITEVDNIEMLGLTDRGHGGFGSTGL